MIGRVRGREVGVRVLGGCIPVLMALAGCASSGSGDGNGQSTAETLNNLAEAYETEDADLLLAQYHDDYLNDGFTKADLAAGIADYMAECDFPEVTNTVTDSGEVDGASAWAKYDQVFESSCDTPSRWADLRALQGLRLPGGVGAGWSVENNKLLAWFARDSGSWLIHGNQSDGEGCAADPDDGAVTLDDVDPDSETTLTPDADVEFAVTITYQIDTADGTGEVQAALLHPDGGTLISIGTHYVEQDGQLTIEGTPTISPPDDWATEDAAVVTALVWITGVSCTEIIEDSSEYAIAVP